MRSLNKYRPFKTPRESSVSAIKEITETISRVSEISSTVAIAVEEQGAATGRIAQNVQQASEGTSTVASNISDVEKSRRRRVPRLPTYSLQRSLFRHKADDWKPKLRRFS